MPATIELQEHLRKEAIASIQRYFQENFPEEIGTLPAGLLLDFFLEEIGPVVYNRAVTDVQERLQTRLMDLPGEVFMDSFQYWPGRDARRNRSKR